MLVGPGELRLMGEDAKRAALGDFLSKADATSRNFEHGEEGEEIPKCPPPTKVWHVGPVCQTPCMMHADPT